jgi:transketolase
MVGYAAGLAKTGMTPFVYSITPFLTVRCLEQIKLDICYNRARVVIVGVGGGFAYGEDGPSHHGTDDVGLLATLPGLRIWTPADPEEVRMCVRAVPDLPGPAYLRLQRAGEPGLPPPEGRDEDLEMPVVHRRGEDVVLMSFGPILGEALRAADRLAPEGVRTTVIHLPTFHPFPSDRLLPFLANGTPVVTVEEHVAAGGLGQHVAALIVSAGTGNPLRMLHVPAEFPSGCLGREAALTWSGIDAASIAATCRELLRLPSRG